MKPGYDKKLIISDVLTVISVLSLFFLTTELMIFPVVWLIYSLISFASTYEYWNSMSRKEI